ncbi:MAG: HIT domain-containing protein [bacterium]|nr:HIT domain-containing protein [bacterium]
MENCIFCKIIKGDIPSYRVFEDNDFLAFLDIQPQSPGHVQVIPKNHHRWVWDVPNAGAYFEVVQKVAKAQRKAFDTDFIISKMVGDEVHHAHIWVFPNNKVLGDKKAFELNAQKIRENIN